MSGTRKAGRYSVVINSALAWADSADRLRVKFNAGEPDAAEAAEWVLDNQISILNIAGPRGSQRPDVYHRAKEFLNRVLVQRTGPEQ